MNALVLSAGGMYGAYQAGAWKELANVFRPDLVIGASIGAVNGWAIAGGCEPSDLIHRWLNLEAAARYRWKFPSSIFGGILDSRPLQGVIREIHESFRPRVEFATVITDLQRLQPRIVDSGCVTWQHLAATTAIVGLFDQVRIDGHWSSDGGLLAAVPLWAAAKLGATKALVINVLPEVPGLVAKTVVGALRLLSSFRPIVPEGMEVMCLGPSRLLGKPLEAIFWRKHNAEQWIERGEHDAAEAKHFIGDCFERE
jgi:NTE family protein